MRASVNQIEGKIHLASLPDFFGLSLQLGRCLKNTCHIGSAGRQRAQALPLLRKELASRKMALPGWPKFKPFGKNYPNPKVTKVRAKNATTTLSHKAGEKYFGLGR